MNIQQGGRHACRRAPGVRDVGPSSGAAPPNAAPGLACSALARCGREINFEPVMRSILLVNVAQLHVALQRFGCSDLLSPLQSAHICCKVRKPTFRYVLQTGAYNRLLRGKCGTWTLNRKASPGAASGGAAPELGPTSRTPGARRQACRPPVRHFLHLERWREQSPVEQSLVLGKEPEKVFAVLFGEGQPRSAARAKAKKQAAASGTPYGSLQAGHAAPVWWMYSTNASSARV